jgi:hypothetical protein
MVGEGNSEETMNDLNKEFSGRDFRRSLIHRPSMLITQKEGYEFASKIVVYDRKSLYLFYHKTTTRRVLVGIAEAKAFDLFILLLILINSAGMIMYDYKDRSNQCRYNQLLERMMNVTTYLFICEAVIKILAQGFWFHKNAYLCDLWNCIDFFVVVTSILELSMASTLNMRFLRTLRVFRPLRSINKYPAM